MPARTSAAPPSPCAKSIDLPRQNPLPFPYARALRRGESNRYANWSDDPANSAGDEVAGTFHARAFRYDPSLASSDSHLPSDGSARACRAPDVRRASGAHLLGAEAVAWRNKQAGGSLAARVSRLRASR